MSETPDWRGIVHRYAQRGVAEDEDVRAAEAQAGGLRDTDEFWEAVYTLVRQRAQMRGAAEV